MSRMLRDYAYQGTEEQKQHMHSDPQQSQIPEHHRALLQEIAGCTQFLVAASNSNKKATASGSTSKKHNPQQANNDSNHTSARANNNVGYSPLLHARKKKEIPTFLAPIVIHDAQITMIEQKHEQERQQQQQHNSRGKQLQSMQAAIAAVASSPDDNASAAMGKSAMLLLSEPPSPVPSMKPKKAVMFSANASPTTTADGSGLAESGYGGGWGNKRGAATSSGSKQPLVLSHFELQQQLEFHAQQCTELRRQVYQLLFDAAMDPAAETSPTMMLASFQDVLGLLRQHDNGVVPQVLANSAATVASSSASSGGVKNSSSSNKKPVSSSATSSSASSGKGRCTVCGGASAAIRNALGITTAENSPKLTNACAVQSFFQVMATLSAGGADSAAFLAPEALSVLRGIFRRVSKLRDYRVSEAWLQILEYFFLFPAVVERVLGHAEALSVAFRPQAHAQSSAARANRLQLASLFASDSDEDETANSNSDGMCGSDLTAKAAAALDVGSSSSDGGATGDSNHGASSSSSPAAGANGGEEVGALPRVETNKDYLSLVRHVAGTLCRSGLVDFLSAFVRDLTQMASGGDVAARDVSQETRLRLAYLIRIASLCEGYFIDHDYEQQQQALRVEAILAQVSKQTGGGMTTVSRDLFGGHQHSTSTAAFIDNMTFASGASSPMSNASFPPPQQTQQQQLLQQHLAATATAYPPRCSLRGLALDWISQRLRFSADAVRSTEMRVLFGAISSSVSTLCAITPRPQISSSSSSSSATGGGGGNALTSASSVSAFFAPSHRRSSAMGGKRPGTTNVNSNSTSLSLGTVLLPPRLSVTLYSPNSGVLSPIHHHAAGGNAAAGDFLLRSPTSHNINSPAKSSTTSTTTTALQIQIQRLAAHHRAITAAPFVHTVSSSLLRNWGALPPHPHLPAALRFTDEDQSQHDLLRFTSFVVRYIKKFCATFSTAAGAAGSAVSWDDEVSLQRKQSLARVQSILDGPKSRRARSHTMKHFSESTRLLSLHEAKFLYRMLYAFNHVLSLVKVPATGAMEGATTIPASAFAPMVQLIQLLCDQHRLLLKRNLVRRDRALELAAAERRAHKEAEQQALKSQLQPPPPPLPRKIPGERADEDEAVNRAIACATSCAARLIPRPVPTGQFWEACEPLSSASTTSGSGSNSSPGNSNKNDKNVLSSGDDDDDNGSQDPRQAHGAGSNKSSDANFVSTVFHGLSSLLLRGRWSLIKMLPNCPLDAGDLSRLLASLTVEVPWFPADRALQTALAAVQNGEGSPPASMMSLGLSAHHLPLPLAQLRLQQKAAPETSQNNQQMAEDKDMGELASSSSQNTSPSTSARGGGDMQNNNNNNIGNVILNDIHSNDTSCTNLGGAGTGGGGFDMQLVTSGNDDALVLTGSSTPFQMPVFRLLPPVAASSVDVSVVDASGGGGTSSPALGLGGPGSADASVCLGSAPKKLQHLQILSLLPPYVQAWRAFGFGGPLRKYSTRFSAWVSLVNGNIGNQYVTSLRHIFNTAQDALRICEVCLSLPARLPESAAFDEGALTDEHLEHDVVAAMQNGGLPLSPVKVAELASQRAADRSRNSALGLLAGMLAERSDRATAVGLIFLTLREDDALLANSNNANNSLRDGACVKERAKKHSGVIVKRLVDNGLVDIPLSVLSLVERWVKAMEATKRAQMAAAKKQHQIRNQRHRQQQQHNNNNSSSNSNTGHGAVTSDDGENSDDEDEHHDSKKSHATAAAAGGGSSAIPWFQTESQDIFAFAVRQLSEAAEYSPEARKRILEHKILAGSLQQLAERIFSTNALATLKLDGLIALIDSHHAFHRRGSVSGVASFSAHSNRRSSSNANAMSPPAAAAPITAGADAASANALSHSVVAAAVTPSSPDSAHVSDDVTSAGSLDSSDALATTAVLSMMTVRRGFFSGLTGHMLQRALNSGGMLDRLKLMCEVAPHLAAVAKSIQERYEATRWSIALSSSSAPTAATSVEKRSRSNNSPRERPAAATDNSSWSASSSSSASVSFYQTPFFANSMFAVCCIVLHGLPILNPEDLLQDPSLLLQAHEALHSVLRALTALVPDPASIRRPSSRELKQKKHQMNKNQMKLADDGGSASSNNNSNNTKDHEQQQFVTMSLLPLFKLRLLKFQPWYKDLQLAASGLIWRALQSDEHAALCNVRTRPHPDDDSPEAEQTRAKRFTLQSFQRHVRLTLTMRKMEADRAEQAFLIQRCLAHFLEIVDAETASRDAVHRRDAAARRRYAMLNEQRAQLDRFLSVDRRSDALAEEYEEFCAIERLALEDIERVQRAKKVAPVEELERMLMAQVRDFFLFEYQYRIQHVYGPESVAWNAVKREATIGLAMVRKHYGKLCDMQLAEFNARALIAATHKKRFEQNIAPLWGRAVIEATETRTRRLDVEAKTQESYTRIRREFFNSAMRVFQRYEIHARAALAAEYKQSYETKLEMHFDMLGAQADEVAERIEMETMFTRVFCEIAHGWLQVRSDWLSVCERAARERILIEASEAQYGPKHWILPTLKAAANESAHRTAIQTTEAQERAAFTRAWIWACQLAVLDEERAVRRNLMIGWAFQTTSIRFGKDRQLLEAEELLRRRMEERGYHDDLCLLRSAARASSESFRPQLAVLQEHAAGAAAISSEEGWLRTGLVTLVRERLLALRKILREYEKVAAITKKLLESGEELIYPPGSSPAGAAAAAARVAYPSMSASDGAQQNNKNAPGAKAASSSSPPRPATSKSERSSPPPTNSTSARKTSASPSKPPPKTSAPKPAAGGKSANDSEKAAQQQQQPRPTDENSTAPLEDQKAGGISANEEQTPSQPQKQQQQQEGAGASAEIEKSDSATTSSKPPSPAATGRTKIAPAKRVGSAGAPAAKTSSKLPAPKKVEL